jgi:glyceraldehyde 3-phosphate dehydrogenase
MKRQIDFIASPDSVSTDFVGSRHASIVDANATIVNGRQAVVYLWYDNEFGYSCQVIRVVQHISGIEYPQFPEDAAPARLSAVMAAV